MDTGLQLRQLSLQMGILKREELVVPSESDCTGDSDLPKNHWR